MAAKNTQRNQPLHSLEREMVIAGCAWMMIAFLCILAANALAKGLS